MAAKTYTSREAAKAMGVSPQTLYTWINRGLIGAPAQLTLGKSTIRVWSAADIERARKFKGTLKGGRPSKLKKKA